MKFYVKPFKNRHIPIVNKWLIARNLPTLVPNRLPQIGYICFHTGYNNNEGSIPVAVGFLNRMEGGTAVFDGLCTNPDETPVNRDYALDILVDKLLKKAKENNILNILAWTQDKNTLLRGIRFGFQSFPNTFTLFGIDLKNSK